MPTPAELRSEIETGPLAATLATSWAAGDDVETLRLLSVKRYPGPVPLDELSAYCLAASITGAVQALDEIRVGEEIMAGVPMTLPMKGLLKTVLTLVQTDFRLTTADVKLPAFAAAMDGLISLGAATAEDKAALIAMGDNRHSRLDVLGWSVSHLQVGEARAA